MFKTFVRDTKGLYASHGDAAAACEQSRVEVIAIEMECYVVLEHRDTMQGVMLFYSPKSINVALPAS